MSPNWKSHGRVEFLALCLALSCGGKHREESGVGAAGASADQGFGGTSASAGTGGTGGGAIPHGTEPDFVPEAPPAYDETNHLDSFEGGQGTTWDTCTTHTPETLALKDGGSDGDRYLWFQSTSNGAPEPSSGRSSASELYVWFAPETPVTDHLYFDAKNLGGSEISGALRFYGTNSSCREEELLAEIDLAELKLSSDWAVRCVSLDGLVEHDALGVAVTGGSHTIGLDAFRFGRACHTQR